MLQQSGFGPNLPTQQMVPQIQRIGERDIEMTFLGLNTHGRPTWILWNPTEPFLLGMLTQGRIGFTFEQRTSHGVLLHENVSLERVRRALTA